jgi:hypothetical protein
MATGADLRQHALRLPGTVEQKHMDRRAFKLARIYATLAADHLTANLKFTPEEQEWKCLLAPETFQPVANAWGRQGWTQLVLSAASQDDLHEALELAYAHARKATKIKS